MAKLTLKIEHDTDQGLFLLLMLAHDGIWDILSEHPTRAEAKTALQIEREGYRQSIAEEAAERRMFERIGDR